MDNARFLTLSGGWEGLLLAYLSNMINAESQWLPVDRSASSSGGFQHTSPRVDSDLQNISQS